MHTLQELADFFDRPVAVDYNGRVHTFDKSPVLDITFRCWRGYEQEIPSRLVGSISCDWKDSLTLPSSWNSSFSQGMLLLDTEGKVHIWDTAENLDPKLFRKPTSSEWAILFGKRDELSDSEIKKLENTDRYLNDIRNFAKCLGLLKEDSESEKADEGSGVAEVFCLGGKPFKRQDCTTCAKASLVSIGPVVHYRCSTDGRCFTHNRFAKWEGRSCVNCKNSQVCKVSQDKASHVWELK